ncbi:hypothetical protein DICPUDRAFT_159921 [Dictyostelium purpureum]|uniref:S1-like domain-containing protein n=1 Tax=Dictyostelium purpureum TaxID=5786 RepID=F1A5A5_DICPU|nr:uncharacterized protein DICPUDRAFT_159921 [Dictyostelium purpureum]EGC28627.1 hypothetical protein DICPUDRAFT_159921 [Dictyostelium purpureum]|eukprot:XP_003294850.1 hypothetical protein DICPUDRAFT_159921 [Dictyostelium purpureum]
MSHARKHVTNKSLNSSLTLEQDQSIVKVVDIRGGNVIEVQYANESKVLAILPQKFNKVLWIKKGNYAIVDKEDESSKQVRCVVSHILSKENIKGLVKSNEWPKEFELEDKNQRQNNNIVNRQILMNDGDSDEDNFDDLGMGNPNRKKYGYVDSDEEEVCSDEEEEEEEEEN